MDSTGWDGRYAATDLVWSAEPNQFLVGVDFSQVALDKARRMAERRGLAVDH